MQVFVSKTPLELALNPQVSLRAKRGNLIAAYSDCFVALASRNDEKGRHCFLNFDLSFCIFVFSFYISTLECFAAAQGTD
jgi:hypothetical protein